MFGCLQCVVALCRTQTVWLMWRLWTPNWSKNLPMMILLFFSSTVRFVPDKEFSGADHGQRREGPVQFEEDPFGLDKFLEEAKQHGGSKRPSTSSRSKDDYHEKKRRKEWGAGGTDPYSCCRLMFKIVFRLVVICQGFFCWYYYYY